MARESRSVVPRANPGRKGASRSTVRTAEGKMQNRARTQVAGLARIIERLNSTPKVTVDQVAAMGGEWVADVAGKPSQAQLANDGSMSMTLTVPPAYVQDAVNLHRASRTGLVFFSCYVVDMDQIVPLEEDGD